MVTTISPYREPSIMLPSSGPTFLLVGDPYTLLLSEEQTNGAFALFEALCSPGFGPPPHYHSQEDETFYIIEGSLWFKVGPREHILGPGSTIHLPRFVPHAFRNNTKSPVRMLIQVNPAGSFEHYVAEAGEPFDLATYQPASPPSPEHIRKILSLGPKYGITFI